MNVYEQAGREKKAALLVDMLQADGVAAATVERFPEAMWEAYAKAAKVKLPSLETRRMVIQMMKGNA